VTERLLGGLAGLLGVGLTYLLLHLPWGLLSASSIFVLAGWLIGGYIRHLRRMTERDELTGICNRRRFERALATEWSRAIQERRPLSLLFLDVDDFGLVNKRYGHLTGDEALKMIGAAVRQGLRRGDLLARWGGEEFVILLPGADLKQAAFIGERIRTMVQQTQIRHRDSVISVTVSTGVASVPGAARNPVDLLREAIAAQMLAKVQKNTVEIVI
jgi:diguanylate cyclase (GGDEF)-like protein